MAQNFFSVFSEMRVPALLQASRPYFRLKKCRNRDPVCASSCEGSVTALNVAVQPIFSDGT